MAEISDAGDSSLDTLESIRALAHRLLDAADLHQVRAAVKVLSAGPVPPPSSHLLLPLTGQRAVVTGCGAADGIGFACALALCRLGAHVVISSTTARLHDRVAEARSQGLVCHGVVIEDLSSEAGASALIDRAASLLGGVVDILVANAGMSCSADGAVASASDDFALADMPWGAWFRQLEVTLLTAVHTIRAAIPLMRLAKYGRIVVMSSVTGGIASSAGQSSYACAKSGIDGLVRTIALEEASHNITVNAVAPGWIATGSSTDVETRAGQHTPLQRSGTPAEVAAVACFLASPSASYVNGAVIVVDGGNTLQEIKGGC
jgi:3-oxoacyl-[acyl-carrier protein] reductase